MDVSNVVRKTLTVFSAFHITQSQVSENVDRQLSKRVF